LIDWCFTAYQQRGILTSIINHENELNLFFRFLKKKKIYIYQISVVIFNSSQL